MQSKQAEPMITRGIAHAERSCSIHRHSLIALLLLILATTTSTPAAEPHQRLNVLVILSDDQRADTLRCSGNKAIHTPNLDSLADSGTRISNAYCMGAMQGAVCVPARAMLLTGRSLFRISEKLENQPTWPEAFEAEGYEIFMTGKWHNGEQSLKRVFKNARSVFLGGMGWPYELPIRDVKNGVLGEQRLSGEHSVKLFADAAADFIQTHTSGKPWLCYVAFNAPHDPRVSPPEVRNSYDPGKIPAPKNFLPVHPIDIGMMAVRDELLERWPRTKEAVSRHLADYYASITFMDSQIGRILQALEKSGQRQNTLIVFTSDSGLAIGSHGLFGKQSIYEHSMRVPMIFSGPGIAKGRTTSGMTYLHDVFPTLGALAGIPAPQGSEGTPLNRVLTGKTDRVRDEIFLAFTDMQRSIRDDRWKLIRYPRIDVTRLYDLKKDPFETTDLATENRHAALVKRLTGQLESAQHAAGDKAPLRIDSPKPAAWIPPQGAVMEEMIRKNQTR